MKQIFKKPVFKKNQMIITALAAMIAVAGYLNYSGTGLDEDLLSANSSAIEDTEDASVAEDISAEDIYAQTGTEETGDIASLDEDTDAEEETEPAAEEQAEAEVGDTVMVGSSVGVGLVSEAKVTREQTRSRNKEILMELINSTNITDEQKQGAIDEMVEMTDIA